MRRCLVAALVGLLGSTPAAVLWAEYASSSFSEELSITLPTAAQSIFLGPMPQLIGLPSVTDGGSYGYRGDIFATGWSGPGSSTGPGTWELDRSNEPAGGPYSQANAPYGFVDQSNAIGVPSYNFVITNNSSQSAQLGLSLTYAFDVQVSNPNHCLADADLEFDAMAYDQSTGLASTLSSISASLSGTAEKGYGASHTVTLPSLVLPANDTVEIILSAAYDQQVLVTVPGDANGDGRVDINDLTTVLAHFGQTGRTWTEGDFNGDGTVDINDLTTVLAHFGDSSAVGIRAAPEPSCVVLLGLGSSACWPTLGSARVRRSSRLSCQ